MTSYMRLFAGMLVTAAMALPAYAQTQTVQEPQRLQPQFMQPQTSKAPSVPTNAELAVEAVTEPETDDDDVTIEDSAILPSAGDQEASRAPSMELDCKNDPKDCLEPLTSEATGPTLSTTPAR